MSSRVARAVGWCCSGRRPWNLLAVVVEAAVGPLSGRVASQTAVSAPSCTQRGATLPPMRVATQPGDIELTLTPAPASAAIIRREYVQQAWPGPTRRPAAGDCRSAHSRLRRSPPGPSNANKRPTDTPRDQRQPRRSAAQPHGRSLPALELTTARYTRAYQSQHQERKFFPRRICFALGLAVQHLR
jgi:hypothetical protein